MLIDLAVRADQEHGERGKAKGEREKQPSIPHSPFPIPHSPPKSKIQNPKSKIQNLQGFHWADLGTGSGAIAMGLATAFPEARIHAIDQSGAALAIAQANAADYGLSDRIHFYQGSWLEPLTALKGQIWGIASNPPYIPSQMVLELQPEITQHEPHTALDGGPDGLDCIRHLIATAPTYLQPGGIFLLEMMAGQAPLVVDLLHQQGNYKHIQIHKDLAGIERFVLAHRKLCTLEL
jgi:release factor glutamine methyltransferase